MPAQGTASVQVAFAAPRRGLHRVPTLTAETRFPLGTFRVWTVWRPAAEVLVYPAPEPGVPPLPPGEPRAGGTGRAPQQGTGEFEGVRAYRRGDPLQLVVWKKAAQALASGSDALVSRDAQQAQRQLLAEKQAAYAKVRSVSSMTQDLQTLERQLWSSMPSSVKSMLDFSASSGARGS